MCQFDNFAYKHICMINFDKFELDNGLQVIVHQDKTTPIVAFNVLYKVGSRNENPDRTGLAHLFEHLMFEGSINISDYDRHIQLASGENNAFTTSDYTNYYITLPKQNIETAFWLESDRMLELDFSEEKLKIQKGVVIEEFNQRYLNKPYADWRLIMHRLAYHVHPYMWPTIGKNTMHIEYAKLQEIKDFYFNFYAPNNAILVVAGDVETKQVKELAEKWFGPIPRRNTVKNELPAEPKQMIPQELEIERNVPLNAIYKAYHMGDRLSKNYYASDLISDILSNGESSRLTQRLVKQQNKFTNINAYILGSNDPGLFFVEGFPAEGVSFEEANKCIINELENIWKDPVSEDELTKVKNKIEMTKELSEVNVLNKAISLAYYEMLGDANLVNTDIINYQNVSRDDIEKTAKEMFTAGNSSTIYYKSAQKDK